MKNGRNCFNRKEGQGVQKTWSHVAISYGSKDTSFHRPQLTKTSSRDIFETIRKSQVFIEKGHRKKGSKNTMLQSVCLYLLPFSRYGGRHYSCVNDKGSLDRFYRSSTLKTSDRIDCLAQQHSACEAKRLLVHAWTGRPQGMQTKKSHLPHLLTESTCRAVLCRQKRN